VCADGGTAVGEALVYARQRASQFPLRPYTTPEIPFRRP